MLKTNKREESAMTVKNQRSHQKKIIETFTQLAPRGICIGHIVGTNEQGDVLVEFDGSGPKTAKLVEKLGKLRFSRNKYKDREVLIFFEGEGTGGPILLDLMADPLESLLSMEVSENNRQELKDVLVDGKKITIQAKDEIVLECGKGSITVRKDGKIIVKGTHLVSRSSGPHKIKGAHVNIN